MAYTVEDAGAMAHEAMEKAKNPSLWGIMGTLLGAAGTATGITALATKVPKCGGCGWNNGFGFNNGCGTFAPTAYQVERKECEDAIALTRAIYDARITELNEARDARNLDVNEKFQLYKSQIDADFQLYKGQRDNFDALKAQIDELRTQVAINSAVRPYQDALIQCDINNARKDAEFNLYRRTCRMIEGEVVLPNTPTVTGFPSYNVCSCPSTSAPASAAMTKTAVK